ncbi:hypothetical protein DFJ43DRAFT_1063427 [Lentinula guzmanii]|uniref:Chromo domain-containing protein n=1 Tax=Lentinula guzmanii TaxID=2804957 RepID=A0AA38MVL2_9AGAR|nr:hypothetical protein DFJ43DRAFT_1063427 [Lentinula guzmanii]
MSAHDSILNHRVKQTRDANRRRRPSPFEEGDLVYISSKNISFPKGLARKLLPSRLKQRGVHDVFHASLLRIHVPNDDRMFPGRLENQVADFEDSEGEWAIERILSHSGGRSDAIFEVKWKSGDITWLPYHKIENLRPLKEYFELIGVEGVSQLNNGRGLAPQDDIQITAGFVHFEISPRPLTYKPRTGVILSPRTSSHSPMSTPAMGKLTLKYFDRSGGDGITWVTDPDKSSAPIHMITDNAIRTILQLNADMVSGKVSTATAMLPEHWDVIVRAFNAEGLEEKFVVIRNDKTFDHVNVPAREATIFGEVAHTHQSSPAWSSISHSGSMGSDENEMRIDRMDHSTESFDATLPPFTLQLTDQNMSGQQTSDFGIYGSMHAPGSVTTPSRFLTADPSTHPANIPANLHFSKITASADVNTKSQFAEPDFRPSSKREKLENRTGPIRNNNRLHRAQGRKQYLELKKQNEESEKLLMRAKEVMFMKALRDHEAMERNRQKKDEKKRVRGKERSREEEIDEFLSNDEYSDSGSNDAGPSFAK